MQNIRGDVSGWETPRSVQLYKGVKAVECRYKCGGFFIVLATRNRPPAHQQCSISAAYDAQMQMRSKAGPVYDRWKARVAESRPHWLNGMRNWINSQQ